MIVVCHNCGAPIRTLSEYFNGIRPDPRHTGDGSGRCVSLCSACAGPIVIGGDQSALLADRSAGWAERPPRRRAFTARDNTGRVMHG